MSRSNNLSGGGGDESLVSRFVDTSGDSITVNWKGIATALLGLGGVELVYGWIRLFRSFWGFVGSVATDFITYLSDDLLGAWSEGLVSAIDASLAQHATWVGGFGLLAPAIVTVELGIIGYVVAWAAVKIPGLVRGAFA